MRYFGQTGNGRRVRLIGGSNLTQETLSGNEFVDVSSFDYTFPWHYERYRFPVLWQIRNYA